LYIYNDIFITLHHVLKKFTPEWNNVAKKSRSYQGWKNFKRCIINWYQFGCISFWRFKLWKTDRNHLLLVIVHFNSAVRRGKRYITIFFSQSIIQWKTKKYHTLTKTPYKIVEIGKFYIPKTHIHDRSLSWYRYFNKKWRG